MTVFGMPRQRDVGSVLEQIGNRVFENQGGGGGGCYERGIEVVCWEGFGYRITRVKLPEMTTHDFEKDSSGCVHTRRFKPKRNPRDGRED